MADQTTTGGGQTATTGGQTPNTGGQPSAKPTPVDESELSAALHTSGLFQKLVTGDTVHYVVCHRQVAVIPPGSPTTGLPTGTPFIHIDRPRDGQSKVKVHCEDLILLGGSHFTLHGVSLEFICVRLLIQGTGRVEFELKGDDGALASITAPSQAAAGAAGQLSTDSTTNDKYVFSATGAPKTGNTGTNSGNGSVGGNGGSFTLNTTIICAPKPIKDAANAVKYEIEVNTLGGNGGSAQPSGQGGAGGDGWTCTLPITDKFSISSLAWFDDTNEVRGINDGENPPDYEYTGNDELDFMCHHANPINDTTSLKNVIDACRGAQGGNGGAGGNGGNGGNAGAVKFWVGDVDTNVKVDVTVISIGTWTLEPKKVGPFTGTTSAANGGTAGKGGSNGSGGTSKRANFWAWFSDDEITNLGSPYKDVTQRADNRDRNHICHIFGISSTQNVLIFGDKPGKEPPSRGSGQNGSNGTAGTVGNKADANVSVMARSAEMAELYFYGPFILGVIKRLEFEYFTAYSQPGDVASLSNSSTMATTHAWLNDMSGLAKNIASGALKDLRDRIDVRIKTFENSISKELDYYGKPRNYVPSPDFSFAEFKDEIKTFVDAEAIYLNTMSIYAKDLGDQDAIKNRNAQLTAQSKDNQTKLDQLRAKISDTDDKAKSTATVTGAGANNSSTAAASNTTESSDEALPLRIRRIDVLIGRYTKTLKQNEASVKTAIEKATNWKFDDAVDSLANCLMMRQPGAAFGIGAGLSTLSTASKMYKKAVDTVESVNGTDVKKDLLYSHIDYLDADGSEQLQDIAKLDATSKERQGLEKQYISQIRLQLNKFDDLCENTLGKLAEEQASKVRTNMKMLIKLSMQKSQLVDEYNQAVEECRRLELESKLCQSALTQLDQAASAYDDVQLQILASSIGSSYAVAKQRAFAKVYGRARALGCALLGPTQAFGHLSEYQSIDGIDSKALDMWSKSYFQQDVDAMVDRNKNDGFLNKTVDFTVSSSGPDDPLFAEFQDSGTFSLLINVEDRHLYNFSETWWDIRVKMVRAYLVGAKKLDATGKKVLSNGEVTMTIIMDGECQYVTKKTRKGGAPPVEKECKSTWLFDTQTFGFSYTYGDPAAKSWKQFTDSSNQDKTTPLAFTHEQTGIQAPLLSPFGAWHIKIPPKEVNVSDCTDVIWVFDIVYRPK